MGLSFEFSCLGVLCADSLLCSFWVACDLGFGGLEGLLTWVLLVGVGAVRRFVVLGFVR